MEESKEEKEAKRRRAVAEMKIWGAIIEATERKRVAPLILSLMFRLISLYKQSGEFQQIVRMMGKDLLNRGFSPLETLAPSYTIDEVNVYVRMYNDIIDDLHLHLKEKDKYIAKFGYIKELTSGSTLNDVMKVLFTVGTNILQILGYIIRWIE
ncbi:MAG: hypothetical protein QXR82_06285 [Candidatus Bathyarchaeia archaeon]